MKAADARRQGSRERKRVRQSDGCDGDSDVRGHLAGRLLGASMADSTVGAAFDALEESLVKIARLDCELKTLEELKAWTERLVQLQMHWVDCGVRLDGDTAVRMWDHIDKVLRRITEKNGRRQQLELLFDELPRLLDKAIVLMRNAPGGLVSTSQSKPTPWNDSLPLQAAVDLPHQWLPRVISGICESVEREHAAGRCRPSLVGATRRILTAIRDHNPYAFFSVLYRPPPPLNGGNEPDQWILYYSHQADSIARLLHADFDELDNLAWWMQRPDTTFWRSFARFMRCVRRLALAFHRVMIHFYAAAMQRHDKYITADDIAYEINRTYTAHMSFKLQSEVFGLARWFENSEDAIFYETYTMFPEVLVYVDQWRHEFSVYEHGFAPKERARDYEVGFHKWKTSKSWLEISHQAKRIVQAWRRSCLGSRDYRPLSYEQLGRLEKDIKYRLAKITDLLYKQNLAKWSQQRYQHTRARALMELNILEENGLPQPSAPLKSTQNPGANDNSVVLTESRQESAFRSPTKSSRARLTRNKEKLNSTVAKHDHSCGLATLFDPEEILKWSDDEIDSHEQETERIYELQARMQAKHDKLSLSRLVSNISADVDDEVLVRFDMDDFTTVRGLFADCKRLHGVTKEIVAKGEEIALHGAAEALIKRPSLRIFNTSKFKTDQNTSDHGYPSTDHFAEVEIAVRESALKLLNLHQAIGTDPEAVGSAHELAQEALGLLRRVQSLES